MDKFKSFPNLVIQRKIKLLGGAQGGKIHLAGPIYPDFLTQGLARHWRHQHPVDECPPDPKPKRIESLDEDFVYGGCLAGHFGHFMAEFIHRIVPSIRAFPALRVIYVGGAKAREERLPSYITEVFEHLGIEDRICIVDRPVRVRCLHVFAQQEWLGGPPPPPAYLLALEEIQRRQLPVLPRRPEVLFISRAHQRKGFAAETVLDEIFAALGARLFYPEDHPLAHQLATYLSHPRLLFSEGSALHGLQLLGRLDAELTVLSRRSREMGRDFLAPRVRGLAYFSLDGGMVAPMNKSGRRADASALVFLNRERIVSFCSAYFPSHPQAEIEAVVARALASLPAQEFEALGRFIENLLPLVHPDAADDVLVQLRALNRFDEPQIASVAALLGTAKA